MWKLEMKSDRYITYILRKREENKRRRKMEGKTKGGVLNFYSKLSPSTKCMKCYYSWCIVSCLLCKIK
jgi:hypothetical protein